MPVTRFRNLQRRIRGIFRGGQITYSQEGEDALLWRIIGRNSVSEGRYVDVGCNQPFRMSNTALLYERGWSGVAIDPNPDFQKAFARHRPRDTYVNCGIGNSSATLNYYRFTEPLYNTLDPERSERLQQEGHSDLVESIPIKVRTLTDVLSTVWPTGNSIQFLSIDCEGMDLEVLRSLDLQKFPVECICVESDCWELVDSLNDPCGQFLLEKGFVQISKLLKSSLFMSDSAVSKFCSR